MTGIGVMLSISLLWTATAMAAPTPKPATCRAFGYDTAGCDIQHGFSPPNGMYLEGIGLETLHFVASKGRLAAFPPAGGTTLKAEKPCGSAHLIPNMTIMNCRANGKDKDSATCTVHFEASTPPPICITQRGQKGNGDETLIAVPGYWDGTGAYREDASTITFACDVPDPNAPTGAVNSAVGTCIGGHYSLNSSPPNPADSRSKFLACVRAIRADYCGDGTPHTRAYTPIAIHDNGGSKPIHPMERKWCANGDEPDGFDYEATWSPDGAVCFFHDRWTGKEMSDDACNTKIIAQPCNPNDTHAIVSTRSNCNVCPSYVGSAPICTPDRDPVCATSSRAKAPDPVAVPAKRGGG
jgi:hypothetical protein